MEFTQVIENRYSCKNFSARQLAPAQLDAILAAGRVAPTAKNLQEQRIYVIQSAQGWPRSTLPRLAVTAHRPALW